MNKTLPEAKSNPTPTPTVHDGPHRRAALRALRQFHAARRGGDEASAAVYLAALQRHVDDHLQAVRAQRRRLS